MLGQEGDFVCASDWDDPARSALWRYHGHYFDDLRANGAEQRVEWNRALIQRWIDEVQPGLGVGWDPYPTSLRIVNWVRFGLGTERLTAAARHSLAVQARLLRRRLEHHLLGNHLLANAKALIFAGVYFSGPEAEEWLRKGVALLDRELREQVLADGGHFERSPMYHALVLEDLLDVLALAEAAPAALSAPPTWFDLARSMGGWLAAMAHPDGEISLFNDAAIGQAPSPAALETYARRLGLRPSATPNEDVLHLAASGFVRIQRGPLFALCDVGEIGPSYLPGHAHADTLTFEASLAGARWIVDSGTSHYEPGAERLRQRSTSAHNTVEVDGESSSEVWGSFRVARRAHPIGLEIERDVASGDVIVRCGHDGYRRASGKVVHRRTWRFGSRELSVRDELGGRYRRAIGRLHLHPEYEVDQESRRLARSGAPAVTWNLDGARARVEASTWHPSFGATLASKALSFDFERPSVRVDLKW